MAVEGTTTIKNDVLVKIAVQAAQEVEGVAQVGASSAARSIAQAFGGGKTSSSGIDVTPGQPGSGETSFNLIIVTLFGYSIPEVAQAIREAISSRIGALTGLTVRRVDIHVEDIKEQGEEGKSPIPFMSRLRPQEGEEQEKEKVAQTTELPSQPQS